MLYTQPPSGHRNTAAALAAIAALLLLAAPALADGPRFDFQTPEGSVMSGTWVRGTQRFEIQIFSPRGIRSASVMVDGVSQGGEVFLCHPPQVQPPCPTGRPVQFPIATDSFADGVHTATVEAADSDGAVSRLAVPVRFDNTPPAPPSSPIVDGGAGWRSQPDWRISWSNPGQQAAPLGAVRYKLCPAEADSSDPLVASKAKAACVAGEYAAADLRAIWGAPGFIDALIPASHRHELTSLPEFRLPGPGLWTLRVWLVDSGIGGDSNASSERVPGNSNPDAPMVISGLGYDPTPPQVAGFAAQDPSDPARLFVGASEDTSPLTGGAIEVQRVGSELWRPLPTDVRSDGISAFVDDEKLRRGVYRVRATVTNAAGLQQGTDRGSDGELTTLQLPIRAASRVQAGRRVGKVCRHYGRRSRCRMKLARRVTLPLGRRITLRARLTVARRPAAYQPLELWQRKSVAGSTWRRIGSVQTNARGRLRYKTRRGVARKLRFRYPGTPLIRGNNGTVDLRVRARSTLHLSRRDVINGEYVTFHGRLKGRRRPPAGLLVELQVFSRDKWRTFAQPRANAAGKWRYQYRFETVSANARFRFRARVRRQAGYPFATGSSRAIVVRVHGL